MCEVTILRNRSKIRESSYVDKKKNKGRNWMNFRNQIRGSTLSNIWLDI